MSDLQKRLAHAIGVTEAELASMTEAARIAAAHYRPLLIEARRALEAMAGEVERLTTNGIHSCWEECPRLPCVQGREIRRLASEVERLKGVLEARLSYHGLKGKCPCADCREIRSALEAKP